jgi:hypothetical protein
MVLGAALTLGAAQPAAVPEATPAQTPVASAVPPAAPPAATPDQCGAKELQYLVGRPKIEIPIPIEPGRRRVICTTCPRMEDIRPDRQTIIFDQTTSLVTAVTCN